MPRTKILKSVVFVALAIIAVRLFFIQIIEHDAWVAKADEAHTLLETIVAKRGEIYMMDDDEPDEDKPVEAPDEPQEPEDAWDTLTDAQKFDNLNKRVKALEGRKSNG